MAISILRAKAAVKAEIFKAIRLVKPTDLVSEMFPVLRAVKVQVRVGRIILIEWIILPEQWEDKELILEIDRVQAEDRGWVVLVVDRAVPVAAAQAVVIMAAVDRAVPVAAAQAVVIMAAVDRAVPVAAPAARDSLFQRRGGSFRPCFLLWIIPPS